MNRIERPFIAGLAVALFLLGHALSAVAGWATYQGNSSHTGYVPGVLFPKTFSPLWQRTDLGPSLNPPVIGSGKVFVSNGGFHAGGTLQALDTNTGTTAWSISPFGTPFSINPPAYANGTVYIQTCNHGSDTYLHAFGAANGGLVYRAAFSAQWEQYFAPTPFATDIYINGGYFGGAYAFSGQDGTQRWFTGLPQYDNWTPAVDNSYVYAYVGEYSPAVYAMNRTTGTLEYSIADPDFSWDGWSMRLAPVLGSRGDLLAIHNGRLINFDLTHRWIRWQLSRNFSGQPTLANGVIYAIDSNTLTAWDEITGGLLWSWAAPNGAAIQGTIIATDSHVFVGTNDSTYAVHIASHLSEWSYPVVGSLALSDGILYVAASTGQLTAIAVPELGTTLYFGMIVLILGQIRNARRD